MYIDSGTSMNWISLQPASEGRAELHSELCVRRVVPAHVQYTVVLNKFYTEIISIDVLLQYTIQ